MNISLQCKRLRKLFSQSNPKQRNNSEIQGSFTNYRNCKSNSGSFYLQ